MLTQPDASGLDLLRGGPADVGVPTGPGAAHPALAALDQAGVRWAVLRGGTGSRDTDILVTADDLPRAVAALQAQGLLRIGAADGAAFLVGRSRGSWLQFDLGTELAFGHRAELATAAASACLKRRRREAGVWVLAPEDEFWALLLHCVLDKGAFADRHRRRLTELAAVASLDSPVLEGIPATVPSAGLLADARAGRWDALAAAGPAVRRAWRAADPPLAPVFRAGRAARAAAARVARAPRAAWRQRGLSVALLGPDGAGKSTLAEGIDSTFHLPVRRIYMGLWPRSEAPPRGPVGAALGIARRPLVIWSRYLAGFGHRALGRLVVFDRYVYDALLPPQKPFVLLKHPYLWALSRACPAPDLVILLDAPGDLMHVRCGDRAAAELEAERAHFARIAERIPRLVRLRSDRPAEAVLDDALEHIWRHYVERAAR